MTTYRYTDSSGRTVYSDQMPVTRSKIDVIENSKVVKTIEPYDYDKIKDYIDLATGHIPKADAYVGYLKFLYKNDRVRFQKVMKDLKPHDPELWMRLQNHEIFRPISTAQRLNNALNASVDLFSGQPVSAGQKWFEGTLIDMMKREGFIPRDVLGSKASTLPQKIPVFSASRLGVYLKEESAKATVAATQARQMLAERPMLGATTTAGSRVFGTILGIELEFLNPAYATSLGTDRLRQGARKLFEKGIIDEIEWGESQRMLSQGQYVEMQKQMNNAVDRYRREKK